MLYFYNILPKHKEEAEKFLREHNIQASFPLKIYDTRCIVKFDEQQDPIRLWFEMKFV